MTHDLTAEAALECVVCARALGRADAIRDVLALIDKRALPVCFVEATAEMRGAAAALGGLRSDVKLLGAALGSVGGRVVQEPNAEVTEGGAALVGGLGHEGVQRDGDRLGLVEHRIVVDERVEELRDVLRNPEGGGSAGLFLPRHVDKSTRPH